jgi:hypothetical protein
MFLDKYKNIHTHVLLIYFALRNSYLNGKNSIVHCEIENSTCEIKY